MDVYSQGLPPEDIDFLKTLVLHGVKLGLENISSLLENVGNPHKNFLTVHVGGTNGKGSTVAYVDRILREQGIRTGKFTSPHLIDLAERFQVNGSPIPPEELHEEIKFFKTHIEKAHILPTFFEFCTAIAFHWFSLKKVEWAVIEVGMGGRLDSTNVIQPEVCAITNIGLEHTQYLGDTLEKIAWEKAGIMKKGVPLVTGEKNENVLKVFDNRAKELDIPIWRIGKDFQVQMKRSSYEAWITYRSSVREIENAKSGLTAMYQCENAGVALAIIDWLTEKGYRISDDAIYHGLANVRWHGRFDLVSKNPWLLVDAAHNPHGIKRLVENLEEKVTVVLSVADDKDLENIVKILSGYVNEFIITQFYGKRAMSVEKIEQVVIHTNIPYHKELDFYSALEYGWEKSRQGHKLLVTGSIYAVGQTYEWLIKKNIVKKLEF